MVDYVIGIDPSITGTAITIMKPDLSFIKTEFFTEKKKYYDLPYQQFRSWVVPQDWRNNGDEWFYNLLTNGIVTAISDYVDNWNCIINLEGYSYASTGRVFSIAEFVGLIKHKLSITRGWHFIVTPPSTIKQFVLKGNSNKTDLFHAFSKNLIGEIHHIANHEWANEWSDFVYSGRLKFNLNKIESPLGDVMDSIYIALLTASTQDAFPLQDYLKSKQSSIRNKRSKK